MAPNQSALVFLLESGKVDIRGLGGHAQDSELTKTTPPCPGRVRTEMQLHVPTPPVASEFLLSQMESLGRVLQGQGKSLSSFHQMLWCDSWLKCIVSDNDMSLASSYQHLQNRLGMKRPKCAASSLMWNSVIDLDKLNHLKSFCKHTAQPPG